MELLLLRLILWVGLPLVLVALAVGPGRCWARVRRLWAWVEDRRQTPAEVLNRVVRRHEGEVRAVRGVLTKAEAARDAITLNLGRSERAITALEAEARDRAAGGDDLGARAALYKLSLERLAVESFRGQLADQTLRVDGARRRLHLLELQLRQYEVGRAILLSQLAEAGTVEQQYALADGFDPFRAVAAWEAADTGRAAPAGPAGGVCVDPGVLDAQLAELKARVRRDGL